MNKPVVNLSDNDGNAFNIVGLCRKAARNAGWTKEQIDAMCKEMMSGNYDNVLQTAMKYFEVE